MSKKEDLVRRGQQLGLDNTYAGSQLESLKSIAANLGMNDFDGMNNSDTEELEKRLNAYQNNNSSNQSLNGRNIPFQKNTNDKTTPNKLQSILNKNRMIPQTSGTSFNNENVENGEENQEKQVEELEKQVASAAIKTATDGAINGKAADVLGGFAVKGMKLRRKIIIIVSVSFAVLLFLFILGVFLGTSDNSEVGGQGVSYAAGSIDEDELVKQLMYYGYCNEEDDCRKKGIYKLFTRLKDVSEDYTKTCTSPEPGNDNPCEININTALLIETINHYQESGMPYDDNDTGTTEETVNNEGFSLKNIFSKIVNSFKEQQRINDMTDDVEKLALAQSEYVKQRCVTVDEDGNEIETISYFYQLSFNKYISYLAYGDSSTHPNYQGKPVEVESCAGPQNDYIPTNYGTSTGSSGTTNKYANVDVTINGDTKGAEIARYALQFVGNKYVYGADWNGEIPYTPTDCSGFTEGVHRHFGITIPSTSSTQRTDYANYGGILINGLNSALPGDLILYSGHVALYLGEGKIVHASNSAPYPSGGIKITENANYRPILAIVRYWDR